VQIKVSIQHGHIAHTSLIYVWYSWVGCAMKRRVRAYLTTQLDVVNGVLLTRTWSMSVSQFDEAEAWGKLALDLVEKHYANSRFADRGEVWIIYYCTLPPFSLPPPFSPLASFLSQLHATHATQPLFTG
jgi:hypothetical protein